MPKYWHGSTPICQLCGQDELSTFMDAALPDHGGTWAMVCPQCFDNQGCSLGTGHGQQYTWAGGAWEKTGG